MDIPGSTLSEAPRDRINRTVGVRQGAVGESMVLLTDRASVPDNFVFSRENDIAG
ncbi:hypothetical protein [Bradyrhizobium sp.]|jgi:hypothetical protein|uniref:hypothetical protein n=1 Tax=Bradyrhizobium sp. TaxID=376 RepID=UPI0025C11AB8|nr:hypothetical protein [Bradyrhizobium sp.]